MIYFLFINKFSLFLFLNSVFYNQFLSITIKELDNLEVPYTKYCNYCCCGFIDETKMKEILNCNIFETEKMIEITNEKNDLTDKIFSTSTIESCDHIYIVPDDHHSLGIIENNRYLCQKDIKTKNNKPLKIRINNKYSEIRISQGNIQYNNKNDNDKIFIERDTDNILVQNQDGVHYISDDGNLIKYQNNVQGKEFKKFTEEQKKTLNVIGFHKTIRFIKVKKECIEYIISEINKKFNTEIKNCNIEDIYIDINVSQHRYPCILYLENNFCYIYGINGATINTIDKEYILYKEHLDYIYYSVTIQNIFENKNTLDEELKKIADSYYFYI